MDNIREGFLCPICVQDLGSFHKLQHHFESAHSAEDKAVFDQVKGLFTKAKGKILGRNESNHQITNNGYEALTHHEHVVWEPQEIGVVKSHFDKYKKFRDSRIDRFVIESNKVLIRLDKLIYFDELQPAKRKEFEQTLVPWVRDEDVPFCPTCGDRFNVARRRHHCRLCGSIMCTKCSRFITYTLADELVETLRESNLSMPRQRSRSLLTVPQTSNDQQESMVRCCRDCSRILQKRKERIEQKYNQPLLVAFYQKLQAAKSNAEKFAPEYKEMADSLNRGEERFELGKANDLRLKLMKLYETIDVVGKKIAAMNTEDKDNPPPAMELQLQSSIRRSSHIYLQENMLTLQSLPSLPKLELLQKDRRKEQERRVRRQREEAERERAEAKRLQELEKMREERERGERTKNETAKHVLDTGKPKQHTRQVSYSSLNGLVLDDGWTADAEPDDRTIRQTVNIESDPILEQIGQVQKMLNQAASAGRVEEVKSLTLNLEELNMEYKKQQSVRAFGNGSRNNYKSRDGAGHSIVVNKNPFLEAPVPARNKPSRPKSVKLPPTSTNPFLEENDDILNPFLSSPVNSTETNPFLTNDNYSPVAEQDGNQDPVLHQICYISKCLDNAVKSGKHDEAAILRQNLLELQSLYNTSQ